MLTSNLRRASALLVTLGVFALLGAVLFIALSSVVERAVVGRKVSQVQSDLRTYAIALEAYHVDWNAYPPTFGPLDIEDPRITLRRLEAALLPLGSPVAYMAEPLLEDPFNGRREFNEATKEWENFWALFRDWDVIEEGGPPPDTEFRQPIYFYYSFPEDQQEAFLLMQVFTLLADATPFITEFGDFPGILQRRWAVASTGPDGFFIFEQYLNDGPVGALTAEILGTAIPRFGLSYDPTNGLESHGDMIRFGNSPVTPAPTPLPTRTPDPALNSVSEWHNYD